MAPAEIKALVTKSKGEAGIETVPTPRLRDEYILVKTTAVALNPTDWKHVDFLLGGDPTGARVGCDYAGIVEEVGSKVTKPFKKGDRVAGLVHGSNQVQHEDGAFAEYIVAKGGLAIKIPDNLSDEEASTLGVCLTTVGQSLYQGLKLPLPSEPLETPEPILIYGGSAATGILGIQFAKASGYKVLATSSPANFDYLRSLGADEVFDYHSPSCAADIKAATDNKLRLAWDCVSSADTGKLCAEALSDEGGHYACLLPVKDEIIQGVNPKIQQSMAFAYTAIGEPFEKFMKYPAVPEDYEYAKKFWELSRGLLESGRIKAPRPIVNRGGKGLEGVMVGLQELKDGKVSAGKLVYTM